MPPHRPGELPAPIPCGALIFDMDGLMVDSEPLWLEVERDHARSLGGDWTHELAAPCIGRGIAHTLRTMHERLGVPLDVERDAAAIVGAFVGRVRELELKAGCREIVAAARAVPGLPCAVASSSARRLIDATLGRFDLLGEFDAIASGDDVTRPKPAPDIFLLAAERLRVAPSACVVLEDSLAGVSAARAAGMRVIAVVEHAGQLPEALARGADRAVTDLFAAREGLALRR